MRQVALIMNPNHPRKGSALKVEPITRLKDIQSIKMMLASKPRDLALFVIGINTNLRASDLVQLKVSQVQGLKPDQDFELVEQKTGKKRRLTWNKACFEAVTGLIASRSYRPEDYLFQGQRFHKNKQGQLVNQITAIYVNHLVKRWTSAINLKGRYGAHSLRKTWGYHARVTHGVDIPRLMHCFNHATQRQTLDYLCIQPEEIKAVYKHCL